MWGGVGRVVAGGGMLVGLLAGASLGQAAAPVFGPSAAVNGGALTDSGTDGSPRIVTDGHGTWVTVWASTDDLGGTIGKDSDVLSARSSDLGISWSVPVPVNVTAPSDGEFDFAPALATDGRGLWIAVWVATNGLDTDILVARSTDAGASWSASVPLYADAGSDLGNDDHPQIVSDGAGTWIVVWDSNGRFGTDRDVLDVRSFDGGLTWSAPAAVGSNASTDRGADQRPQLATDGAGTWVVTWASNDTLAGTKGADFDVLFARSTDSGASWTAPRSLNGNAGTDRGLDDRPQLATDGHGTWVAAWVSDDSLGGTLGLDLDLLTAYSTDGGATWTAPTALNANAASDAGADGAPALVTDGHGSWVAVWESNDTLGGTLTGGHDILMAHSIDGGAHWSAPHALDPDAATDGRRDLAPALATDGTGVWNAVWTGAGGALGADGDILRAGGRERCGNGALDPGEQCDDGNTRGGDACPASCEFPPPPTPIATTTAGPSGGGNTAGGTTATPGTTGGATPSSGGAGTPTPNVATSPTPSDGGTASPDASATPTASGGSEPTPAATGSADPAATATPTPSGGAPVSTPTSAGPQPSAVPTASAAARATATGGGAIPTPAVTSFGGGLASTGAAKAAVVCQRAVVKAGAQLVGARLNGLGGCGRAVQRCIQTEPEDPACLEKAAARCRSAFGALAAADRKNGATLRKRCGGALALADVLGPAGLGYASLACGEDTVAGTLEDLVACVVGEHACRSATLFEVLQPRAKELLRLPGMNAATLDTVVCLPDHGGDGATVGDPAGQGKAIESCTTAIVKAGTGFVRKRLARLARCVDGLFSCVQLAPNDGTCLAKARGRCDQGNAGSTAEERKLTDAVGTRCGEGVVAYATLRASRAANLDALAAACTAVGVSELESLADYQQCVLRADACRVEGVLRVEAPRAVELLKLVGRSFGSPYCGDP